MIHAFTVDVEDFHNLYYRQFVGKERPPTGAVVRNVERLLGRLADAGAHGSFFVLGEVAQHFPGLIRSIADQGHELGVHGYTHLRVDRLTPARFRSEVERAKGLIEDISGQAVTGHRAPIFSLTPDTPWAFDVLLELGITYDSSIFPLRADRYGWPGMPMEIHERRTEAGATIVEAPLTAVTLAGRRLPAAGGGYLRYFPYAYNRWAIRRVARERPVIVYMHPCEVETEPSSYDYSGVSLRRILRSEAHRRVQRINRRSVEPRVVRLLQDFDFGPLREVITQQLGRRAAGGGDQAPDA